MPTDPMYEVRWSRSQRMAISGAAYETRFNLPGLQHFGALLRKNFDTREGRSVTKLDFANQAMALPTSQYHLHLSTDVKAISFLEPERGTQISVRISAGIAARVEGKAVLPTEPTRPTDVFFSIECPLETFHTLRILLTPALPQRDLSFLFSSILLNNVGPELVVHYWCFRMEGWQHLRSDMVTVRSATAVRKGSP